MSISSFLTDMPCSHAMIEVCLSAHGIIEKAKPRSYRTLSFCTSQSQVEGVDQSWPRELSGSRGKRILVHVDTRLNVPKGSFSGYSRLPGCIVIIQSMRAGNAVEV